jgi:hypothetical protein
MSTHKLLHEHVFIYFINKSSKQDHKATQPGSSSEKVLDKTSEKSFFNQIKR